MHTPRLRLAPFAGIATPAVYLASASTQGAVAVPSLGEIINEPALVFSCWPSFVPE